MPDLGGNGIRRGYCFASLASPSLCPHGSMGIARIISSTAAGNSAAARAAQPGPQALACYFFASLLACLYGSQLVPPGE